MTRQEQDRWAAISQQRASKAQEEGKFDSEIVPIEVKVSKKETMIFDKDEHVRPGTTAESLAKLRPAFKDDGSVTAGNAAGINDAAAAVVLMKESKAKRFGIKTFSPPCGCGSGRGGSVHHGNWTRAGIQKIAEEDRD